MDKRCITCGCKVSKVFELDFKNLQGMNEDVYTQRIMYCPSCKFIYTENPMPLEQLNNRYKNESKYEFDNDEYMLDEADEYKKRCLRQKCFIDNNIGSDYDSIMEIGAASGYNLSLYPHKKTVGIEPSKNNCRLARRIYGLDMFCGMVSDYLEQEKKDCCDLLFMSHTLEHIVNPASFIEQISSLVNKYIFIEVPCFDYKYIDEPYGMFCEEHVNYFTLENLEYLMKQNGFGLVAANMIFDFEQTLPAGYPAISTIWEKSDSIKIKSRSVDTKNTLDKYLSDNKIRLNEIDKKIDIIPCDAKLAIWGIGHHASMLYSNTSLKNKNLVKVFDGDVRKHKYTFAGLDIESFDEKYIYNGEIDSILVTTYTAQRTIKNILKKYEKDIEIYCLYDI